MMNKAVKITHISLSVFAWGIFALSIIRTAIVWKSLPHIIGVHFASNGTFDVFDSKWYIAYPYAIALIALIICEIIAFLSGKMRLGLRISEAGGRKIRSALKLQSSVTKLCLSFFFSGVWTDCIIRQQPLNTSFAVFTLMAVLLSLVLFTTYTLIIRLRDGKAKN